MKITDIIVSLSENSNLPVAVDSRSPLSKTKNTKPYKEVNQEVSVNDEDAIDCKKKKTK